MIKLFLFLAFWSTLLADPPETVLNAASIYQRERISIKNYKVKHLVVSKIQSPTEVYLEKRVQTGYFIAPDRFLFIVKEKWINGQPVALGKEEVEKTTKREIEWLSTKGVKEYKFTYLGGDSNVSKFKVQSPRQEKEWYDGEIWIHPANYKIIKMIREPSLLPSGYEKFRTEVFFDPNLTFQEPYLSKLEALFTNPKGEKTQVLVDASFSGYEFNISLKTEK